MGSSYSDNFKRKLLITLALAVVIQMVDKYVKLCSE